MEVNQELYQKGTVVICILNNRATLTIGAEYTISHVEKWKNTFTIGLNNDNGYYQDYEAYRFVPKSEFRHHLINQILK